MNLIKDFVYLFFLSFHKYLLNIFYTFYMLQYSLYIIIYTFNISVNEKSDVGYIEHPFLIPISLIDENSSVVRFISVLRFKSSVDGSFTSLSSSFSSNLCFVLIILLLILFCFSALVLSTSIIRFLLNLLYFVLYFHLFLVVLNFCYFYFPFKILQKNEKNLCV